MTQIKFVVPEVKTNDYSTPLEPGKYTGKIVELRPTTIRSGRHQGKKSIDVAVQMEDGRYIWKVLPQFTVQQFNKLSESDKRWVEMSTISFAKALKLVGDFKIDEVIGKEVRVLVGMHQDNGYGPQNSIVKFL
jgi:hypothetical protein